MWNTPNYRRSLFLNILPAFAPCEDLAEEVRKYHIPDFSNWKNHDAFERAFARLEKDLRTSIGK
jgi:hypothetical protein